jgi:death-on-curing protein
VQYLTADDVLAIYTQEIGTPELRSEDGLHSAVGRPQQSAFGDDAYPGVFEKAAALMQSLAQNQPFVDGNKRVAWICTKLFLQLHGLPLRATTEEGLRLMRDHIPKRMSIDEIAAWIEEHTMVAVDGLDEIA